MDVENAAFAPWTVQVAMVGWKDCAMCTKVSYVGRKDTKSGRSETLNDNATIQARLMIDDIRCQKLFLQLNDPCACSSVALPTH